LSLVQCRKSGLFDEEGGKANVMISQLANGKYR
jgi:hypothetical protein